ncbi:hypothetical protein L596_001638 [Steinernema carpocapsae]|uniref:Uncharacterized protein n=1 Tax=Steinernema carpocapsae TaxID=34508 RepID=A0A4U8UMB9_STECR|nr:hypothetical protein L596_001638 [Steinernema carpocapsae]
MCGGGMMMPMMPMMMMGGFGSSRCGTIFLCPCVIFFPPLAVLIEYGCGMDFCISICLTSMFGFPGIFHAMYIIYCSPHNVYPMMMMQQRGCCC